MNGNAQVKAWCADEGFDACGIAKAGPIDEDNTLGNWIDAGHHADMDWMVRTREERQDIQKKLPGTQSVIVVARNYYGNRPEVKPGHARVSRYAWGRDYHNALRKPLRRIANRIAAMEPGAETYCSIDTGPVMEKAWAMRAGLGWIGKNSLVLRKGLGSYFFLGVILTTVEIEPDSSATDQCGGCRLCIDACPTEAIVTPRVVDSRRCISYHTIENRGEAPEDLKPAFGDWAFGCDICQEICPWNRELTETTMSDFRPRRGHDQLAPEEIIAMDEPTFRNEFEGTPITRAKHSGMQRNAQIAQRNLSSADGVGG